MKSIYLNSKRSQIGTTLTWVAALFVILFIMAVFIGATLLIAKAKVATVPRAFGGENSQLSYSETALLEQKLTSFVNMKLGNGDTIYQLLMKAGNNDGNETDRQKLFNEKAAEFFKDIPETGFYARLSLYKIAVEGPGNPLYSEDNPSKTVSLIENPNYIAANGPPIELAGSTASWTIPIYPDKRLTLLLQK